MRRNSQVMPDDLCGYEMIIEIIYISSLIDHLVLCNVRDKYDTKQKTGIKETTTTCLKYIRNTT